MTGTKSQMFLTRAQRQSPVAREEFPTRKSKKNAPNAHAAQATSAIQVSARTMNREAFIVAITQDADTTIVLCNLEAA